MTEVALICRHTVKSVGAETLDAVDLAAHRPMPHDRLWAVAHGESAWSADAPEWQPPRNFLRVTHVPRLAEVTQRYDPATGSLTLRHPDRPELTVTPADDGADLTDWVAPLAEGRRDGPFRLAHAAGAAMTDVPEPWISILNLASLRALGQHLGVDLDPRRFRGNLWLDGGAPWEEEEWVGREVSVGPVRLRIAEPIGRCRATEANPATGTWDAPIVSTLRRLRGESDFGLYAEVIEGGRVALGDPVT